MGNNQSKQREEIGGCCIIKTKIGTAHGILLRTTEGSLETHFGLKSEYAEKCSVALITNHHVVPNIVIARDCTILNGNEEINLSDKDVIDCISCCGYHGILGKHKHLKTKSGEGNDCPFQLDFTILFLDISKLTTRNLKTLHFSFDIKYISGLLDQTNKLVFIQRTDNGKIISCDLTLSEKQGNATYDPKNEVDQYNRLAKFNTKPHCEIKEGSSGGPIFSYKSETSTKELIGIHRLTENKVHKTIVSENLEESKPVAQKNTTIFWILQAVAIYKESNWSQDFPLTLHLALIQSVDFSIDLIDDSVVIKSLKFILDLLKKNKNTSEDFKESPSLVMEVLAASIRKAIEKGKVAHLFEMIDVIIFLVNSFELSDDARLCVSHVYNDLNIYMPQKFQYKGLLWTIKEYLQQSGVISEHSLEEPINI